MFEDGIPAVQPDENARTIEAFDIAELLEVSVAPESAQSRQEIPPGISS